MIQLRREACEKGKKPSERTIAELLDYGVIPIDKPCGPTSHEVSAHVRRILGVKKSGHSGTLDPDVSGVLPVVIGNACKVATVLLKEGKEYVCVLRLGSAVKREELEEALARFRGKIYQTPPEASAVKRELRIREIYELELLEHEAAWVLLRAFVQHGTYMRKLCTDVGEVLGVGGEMAELRRTKAGGFSEKECCTLQDLSDAFWLYKEKGDESRLRKLVRPVEEAVHLKRVIVSDGALKPITTGANLAIPGILSLDEGIEKNELVQVLTGKGELACLARSFFTTEEITAKKNGIAFDVERVIQSF